MKLKSLIPGSTAPLAILFTLVSMSFTIAYLKNAFGMEGAVCGRGRAE